MTSNIFSTWLQAEFSAATTGFHGFQNEKYASGCLRIIEIYGWLKF